MRQQQQQNRSRNRNRGRRTSNNPQSRNFESNGPDVKIRGNANHIAEKYNQLARDALTSGDTVMSENYFQHAEHYSRIVAANQKTNPQPNNNQQQNNRDGGDGSENNNEQQKNAGQDENKNPRGDGPQPEMSETPAEVSLKEENVAVNEDKPARQEKTSTRRNGRRPATTRRTSRVTKKTDDDASLSDDAASLPSGLMGGSDADESASTSNEE